MTSVYGIVGESYTDGQRFYQWFVSTEKVFFLFLFVLNLRFLFVFICLTVGQYSYLFRVLFAKKWTKMVSKQTKNDLRIYPSKNYYWKLNDSIKTLKQHCTKRRRKSKILNVNRSSQHGIFIEYSIYMIALSIVHVCLNWIFMTTIFDCCYQQQQQQQFK